MFRLTATVLQMAQGQVCCGNCSANFNAMEALYDQMPEAAPAAPATWSAPLSDAVSVTDDVAQDQTLEFNVPEQDWARFFVDTNEPHAAADGDAPSLGAGFDTLDEVMPESGPAGQELAPPLADAGEEPLALERETSDTDVWEAFLREPAADEEPVRPLYVIGEADPVAADGGDGPAPEPAPGARVAPAGDRSGTAAPQWSGRARAWPADDELPSDEAGPPAWPARAEPEPAGTVLNWTSVPGTARSAATEPKRAGRWFVGSLLLAVLLAGQLVHYNRDALAADMRYGWLVRTGYGRLGVPLYPAWPLEAYEIRGAEAVAGRTAAGALDVVAQIAVVGKQAVGLPMVRMVLRDRWSNPVGSRVFPPADFLPEPRNPARTYPSGAVIPVLISVADPGRAAQGYELDVCLPDRHRGLQCRGSGDPFRR